MLNVSNRRRNGTTFAASNEEPLILDELRSRYPTIFQEAPDVGVSGKYEFISTEKIIRQMQDSGFGLYGVRGGSLGRSREFGVHSVTMRMSAKSLVPGELYPEVILTNSHDRSNALALDAGLHRVVCANGMIVGEGAGTGFRIAHFGDQADNVVKAAAEIIDYAPRLGEVVKMWGEKSMGQAEIEEFARRAAMLRYGGDEAPDVDWATPRRDHDVGSNLWLVFNRVQENLMDGGLTYKRAGKTRRSVRPIGAVRPVLALNKKLWDLAGEFYEN